MKYPYTLLEKTENTLKVEMFLKNNLDFFDGHFTQFPIMPAVAQLYVVETCAKEIMNLKGTFTCMRQVKFVGPICPDSSITISIRCDNGKVTYEIHTNGVLKSKGILNYEVE